MEKELNVTTSQIEKLILKLIILYNEEKTDKELSKKEIMIVLDALANTYELTPEELEKMASLALGLDQLGMKDLLYGQLDMKDILKLGMDMIDEIKGA